MPSTTTTRAAGFEPMKMHKNILIAFLREHPEELKQVAPEWTGTAEEMISAMEAHPAEWIVGGVLGGE